MTGPPRTAGECPKLSAVSSVVLRSGLCHLVPFRSHVARAARGRRVQETPIFQGFYGRGAAVCTDEHQYRALVVATAVLLRLAVFRHRVRDDGDRRDGEDGFLVVD